MKTFIHGILSFVLLFAVAIPFGCAGEEVRQSEKEGAWLDDFEQARETATETERPILVNFTGSDWCGWCIRLESEVFGTEEFQAFAAEHLVLAVVDFPRRTTQSEELQQQNQQLAQEYGIQGFPTILLLNAEGEEIARTGYRPGGPEAYIAHIEDLLDRPREQP